LSLHAGSDQAVKSTCVQVNTKEKKLKLVHGTARKAMDQALDQAYVFGRNQKRKHTKSSGLFPNKANARGNQVYAVQTSNKYIRFRSRSTRSEQASTASPHTVATLGSSLVASRT
jgi:hypothetical protein